MEVIKAVENTQPSANTLLVLDGDTYQPIPLDLPGQEQEEQADGGMALLDQVFFSKVTRNMALLRSAFITAGATSLEMNYSNHEEDKTTTKINANGEVGVKKGPASGNVQARFEEQWVSQGMLKISQSFRYKNPAPAVKDFEKARLELRRARLLSPDIASVLDQMEASTSSTLERSLTSSAQTEMLKTETSRLTATLKASAKLPCVKANLKGKFTKMSSQMSKAIQDVSFTVTW